MNGPFGLGGHGLDVVRGPGGYGGDTGVSVLAIVLRFTLGVLLILAAVWVDPRDPGHDPRAPGADARRSPTRRPPSSRCCTRAARSSRTDYLTRRADLTGVPHTAPPPA